MDKIEKIIKEYSSKKLIEIVDQQSSSYNSNFIDYAKDELIKRGESFTFNNDLQKEISEMSSDELKKIVESDYDDFHLEYLEIARIEYLRRGFKNDNEFENEHSNRFEKRYAALRTIASIYSVFAWFIVVIAVIIAAYLYNQNEQSGLIIGLPTIVVGALIFLGLLAASELIKVLIDIEENTRKYSDYYKTSEDNRILNSNED